jgi:hypothetical protein
MTHQARKYSKPFVSKLIPYLVAAGFILTAIAVYQDARAASVDLASYDTQPLHYAAYQNT